MVTQGQRNKRTRARRGNAGEQNRNIVGRLVKERSTQMRQQKEEGEW